MPTASPFGDMLRKLRRASRLTQELLAERADFSPIYITLLEGGKRLPPLQTVDRLAEALGASEEERATLRRLAAAREGPLHNLPPTLTPCLGREAQLAEAEGLLRSASVRLLTIKGAPGIGKTRLASELAIRLRDYFFDGVVFVDLTDARDLDQLLALIVQTRGVGIARGLSATTPPAERLVQALYGRRILLILDNLEQVADSGPHLLSVLSVCPDLKLLVTSRHQLQVSGERLFVLGSLPLPDPSERLTVAAARASPAVALFEARAREANPSFRLSAANCADVVAVCAALGGLPLAIRLAAVRVSTLTLPALRERLARPLDVLTMGPSDLPARQQTLERALTWSYELLTPAEQSLFRRLGVFVGSFSLAAVEAIRESVPGPSHLDTLTALVAHSLVERVDDGTDAPRYALLKVIGDFAAALLRSDPAEQHVRDLHADFYLAMVDLPVREPPHPDLRVEDHYPNLLAALDRLSRSAAGEPAARLCAALLPFWNKRCLWGEARHWIERSLSQEAPLPAELYRTLLRHGGLIARRQGDYQRAEELFIRFLELCRTRDDRQGSAYAQNQLGLVATHRGAYAQAHDHFVQSLANWQELGSERNVIAVLGNQASLADTQGAYDEAIARHNEVLALRSERGDTVGVARTLCNLGMATLHSGDFAGAAALFARSLTLAEDLGHLKLQTVDRCNLGLSRAAQGDAAEAAHHLRTSLSAYVEMGDQRGIAYALEGCACAAALGAEPERAARLLGAAAALREHVAAPLPQADQQLYDPLIAPARATLTAPAFEAAWAVGRRLSVAAAIAEALAD